MDTAVLRSSLHFLIVLAAILGLPLSQCLTDPRDVFAINSLYTALGSPPLPGWIASGGDPCTAAWQGVECVESNITGIVLNAANLGGQLGDNLDSFTSMIKIDLSNNHIGGSIPENLPVTMRQFFLSSNNFTGSLPNSLAGLTLLSDMSVNGNHLSGALPDAFQSLTDLVNLDLSDNNISGQFPPSMQNLSSLTTLHLENNQLGGTLGVLQDLPLKDLNIENNLFSGPIPPSLLAIPNFRKDGNPFNTTIAPSASPSSSSYPPPSLPGSPPSWPHNGGSSVPEDKPGNSSNGPSAPESTSSSSNSKKKFSTMRIIGIVIAGVIGFIILMLLLIFCISNYQERKTNKDDFFMRRNERVYDRLEESQRSDQFVIPKDEAKKGSSIEGAQHQKNGNNKTLPVRKESSEKQKDEHHINMSDADATVIPLPFERVIVKPKIPNEDNSRSSSSEDRNPLVDGANVYCVVTPTESTSKISRTEKINPPVACFSVALLQQYTHSFSEDNHTRDSSLGKFYLAELPDGKLLTVMKLDNVKSKLPVDEFFELVLGISELRHPNIVELVGYCSEFDQRLLVYNHHSVKSLNDLLHLEDELTRKLSWNARLRVALCAAKALEYLHEHCDPPVIHQHFESANVLVDEKLDVRVLECGLSVLKSSNSALQLSGRIRSLYNYEAPEVNEAGTYSERSDVYSFGVVMLELLTGRKPYDSSRPRHEQYLVRWVSSQLHDISALSRMVDPFIAGRFPEKSLSRFADIISRCIQQAAEFRPPMSEVVQDLSLIVEEPHSRRTDMASRQV